MAASGRTTYFAIPIYQLGDTCEYIPSYNSGMDIIDAQMQANKSQGLKNQSELEAQGQAIATVQNEIAELNNIVPGLNETEVYPFSVNTQNIAALYDPYYIRIWRSGKIIHVGFTVIFTPNLVNVSDVAVKIAIRNDGWLFPMLQAPGNMFNLSEGATNAKTLFQFMLALYENGTTYSFNYFPLCAWVSGGETNIGLYIRTPYAGKKLSAVGCEGTMILPETLTTPPWVAE